MAARLPMVAGTELDGGFIILWNIIARDILSLSSHGFSNETELPTLNKKDGSYRVRDLEGRIWKL